MTKAAAAAVAVAVAAAAVFVMRGRHLTGEWHRGGGPISLIAAWTTDAPMQMDNMLHCRL